MLYGNTLVLAGIEASLSLYANLEVITLDALCVDAADKLLALNPTVVIFDLGSPLPKTSLSVLDEQSDLLLIGVDAAGDKLLILSGRQSHSLNTANLVQVIERRSIVD